MRAIEGESYSYNPFDFDGRLRFDAAAVTKIWRNLRSDFGVKGKNFAVFIGFLAAPRRRIWFLTYSRRQKIQRRIAFRLTSRLREIVDFGLAFCSSMNSCLASSSSPAFV